MSTEKIILRRTRTAYKFIKGHYLPEKLRYLIWNNKEKDEFWREKILRNDGDDDKVYYIIRRKDSGAGLFSLLLTTIGHIDYAIKRGYVPVVDWQNYPNPYLEKEEVGKINAYEYYFEQPFNVTVDECKTKPKVILSNGNDICSVHERPNENWSFYDNQKKVKAWRYIRCNDETNDYMTSEFRKITERIGDDARILGVLARGTDYLKQKPKGHAVQPDIETIIKKTNEYMKKCDCNYIFLATEDKRFEERFRKEFDGLCIFNERCYIDYSDGSISYMRANREKDRFLRGREYLTNIYILSRCNALVAGRTNGTLGAILMSDGYEEEFLFELGTYGYNRKLIKV